ncbi:MAG: nucleotidyltransferase [Nanoarchaeota archaeon]|nr:nucleotidyltransferase [Nanoarchaeota archaeon]
MIDLEKQNELLSLIGEEIKEKINCYIVGGSAMLYHGVKEATKDIDIVFDDKKSKEIFEKVLRKLGFKERDIRVIYFKKKNPPLLLERGEERIDIFIKKVVTFEITENIKKRVGKVYEYGNLIVKVVSPEDIILFKCATERAGDRIDAINILKKFNINWNIIIEEAINQTKLESYLFPVFLYDFLEELKEDFKADIPREVLKKLREISEEMLEKKLKKKS